MWPQKILWLPAHLKSQERGWMNCVPTRSSFHGCQCNPRMISIAQKYQSQLFHGQKNPMLSYLTSQNTKLNRNQSQAFMPVTAEHNHCIALIFGTFSCGAPGGLQVFICTSGTAHWETARTRAAFIWTRKGCNSDPGTNFKGYNSEEALETI